RLACRRSHRAPARRRPSSRFSSAPAAADLRRPGRNWPRRPRPRVLDQRRRRTSSRFPPLPDSAPRSTLEYREDLYPRQAPLPTPHEWGRLPGRRLRWSVHTQQESAQVPQRSLISPKNFSTIDLVRYVPYARNSSIAPPEKVPPFQIRVRQVAGRVTA